MSHSVKITLIADQFIELLGKEVSVYDVQSIILDERGNITGYSTYDDDHGATMCGFGVFCSLGSAE